MTDTEKMNIDDSKIREASEKIQLLKKELSKKIIGQEELLNMLIIALFANGHVLLEGLPGLAKTLTISTLSQALDVSFSRIQFTPDLLPSDLLGTEIYNAKTADFEIKKWPIFSNFVLADEVNRAPSKVQSALLEAMAEKHITLWKHTFQLDDPFLVLATQNPIEQSGTYTLPEAQLDRFMFKVEVWYPELSDEKEMYKKIDDIQTSQVEKVLDANGIFDIRNTAREVYVSDNIYEYVSNIIDATRNPDKYGMSDIKNYIGYGASPRWWIALIGAAKVHALLEWRDFVIPEDIKALAPYVLCHRIVLSYEAVANDVTTNQIVKHIMKQVKLV